MYQVIAYIVHAIRLRIGPRSFNGGGEILSEGSLVVMKALSGTKRLGRGFVNCFRGDGGDIKA